MIVQHLATLLLGDGGVAAVFADRIYPVQLPDAPAYPCAVITKVFGAEEYTMDGPVGLEAGRVQIDVLSLDGVAALLTAKTVIKTLLSGFHGAVESGGDCVIDSCMCINDFDFPEVSTERAGPRLRRRILEFRTWTKGN